VFHSELMKTVVE